MYTIGSSPNAAFGDSWMPQTSSSVPEPDGPIALLRGDGVAPGFFGSFGTASSGANAPSAGGFGGLFSSAGSGLSGILDAFSSVMSGLMSSIQSALGGSSAASTGTGTTSTGTGTAASAAGGTCGASGCEQGYSSATATSLGDPHLAFHGTSASGAAQNGGWDNMQSHGDLIDSDSFAGGYRVSTAATSPDANGITYNANATVTTDGGAAAVTFGHDGSLGVTENGATVAVASGQSVDLGNGETVTSNADGSATVAQTNGAGASISTTMRSNGPGVDVTTTAANADLGGYLVTGRDSVASAPAAPSNTNAPVGYVPIFADPTTIAGGSWEQPPSASYGPSPFGASTNGGTPSATNAFGLAGFTDPTIDTAFS